MNRSAATTMDVLAERAFAGSLPEVAAMHPGPLTFEAAAPDGSCKVAFFNDPDGNGLSLTQIL